MFALFSYLFRPRKETNETRDDYLKSSTDLADLERRMRQVDEADHAYSLSFCGAMRRDRNAC
jgi:hypothetical protein